MSTTEAAVASATLSLATRELFGGIIPLLFLEFIMSYVYLNLNFHKMIMEKLMEIVFRYFIIVNYYFLIND